MEFFEAPAFARLLPTYLDDDEYRQLQTRLGASPEDGVVIQGTGGFRKMRWTDPRRGKGRRGGLRIIYYYFPAEQQIWLVTLYGKDDALDLTAKEKQVLKRTIDAEIRARQGAMRHRREPHGGKRK